MSGDKDTPKEGGHWPFDPMQPGDHEPVRLPDNVEHLHKQNPAPRQTPKKEKER